MKQEILPIMNKTEDSLDQIKGLTKYLQTLDELIEKKKKELEELESKRKTISEETLPDLFDEAGITAVDTDEGKRMSLDEFFVGSIPKEAGKSAETIRWLEENGFDSIIKNTVTVNLDRGEHEKVRRIVDALEGVGVNPSVKERIHHQTLRAFINERMGQNPDEFPRELFNVSKIRRIKVK